MTEYEILTNKYEAELKRPGIYTHDTELLDVRAKTALEMITHWGMVSGKPDGEDSAGRAKLALASPEEIVDRAVTMTALAFDEFNKNNWITHLPSLETLKAMQDNKELETY